MAETILPFNEYGSWLYDKFKMEIDDRYRQYYESVTLRIKDTLKNSDVWNAIESRMNTFDQAYQIKSGYLLFPGGFIPVLISKSYNSFYHKTYRKNILENVNWPDEPKGGWISPENWFSRIDDIVRTRFIRSNLVYLVNLATLFSRQQHRHPKLWS